jgi:hypothetical protein
VTFPPRPGPHSQQITPLPLAIGNCCAHASSGGVRGGVSLRADVRPCDRRAGGLRSAAAGGYSVPWQTQTCIAMHMHPRPVQRVQASCGRHIHQLPAIPRGHVGSSVNRSLSNVHGRAPFFLSIKSGLHTYIHDEHEIEAP